MTRLEEEIVAYGKKNWDDKDPLFLIRKLGEEFGELAEAIGRKDLESIREETADMGIILVAILGLQGKSLHVSMATKMDMLEYERCLKLKEKENGDITSS